jgi:drug/metabolite transporter (DMT)-like permease
MQKKSNFNGVLSLVLCALLWSTGGFLVKLTDWNPFAIAGMRSLIGFIAICLIERRLPLFFVRKPNLNFSDTQISPIDVQSTFFLYLAAICYSLTMILYIMANKMTTAANTILLQYTDPIYIILFGPLILGEKNRVSDYITVIGVIAGMVLFFADGLSGGNMTGNILAMISGLTWGFCVIFMRRLRGVGSLNAFLIAHIITFLVGLPFMFTSGMPSGLTMLGLFLLGVFQIGLPSILYARGINTVRALTASFISMIEPMMNPVWVLLFDHEVPSLWTLIGGGIIILFIIFNAAFQTRKNNLLQK